MLLTIILLFSELISMPYSAAVSPSELLQFFFTASEQIYVIGKPQIAKRSPSNGHRRQRGVGFFCLFSTASSAKQSFTDEFTGVRAVCIIFSINILNNTGDNGHPRRTPTVVGKKSPAFPFSSTALVASPYNDLMTSISRLYSFKTRQRPSCQTRSNAFLKSMKL